MDTALSLYKSNFNTSHVTVYPLRPVSGFLPHLFQYISCYCLSRAVKSFYRTIQYFNTSHVTVYQGKRLRCGRPQSISIHLMLLFIVVRKAAWLRERKISIHLMLLFINVLKSVHITYHNFNTSHVTVYLRCFMRSSILFQFQYISCYCLSANILAIFHYFYNFNTSHVTVYPSCSSAIPFDSVNFNTSHVTVYRKMARASKPATLFQYISCYCLSGRKGKGVLLVLTFQYISCYCLSYRHPLNHLRIYISIHLMLLFIKGGNIICCHLQGFQYISCYCLSEPHDRIKKSSNISIHLMLLFISRQITACFNKRHFNTSHVTVYRLKSE